MWPEIKGDLLHYVKQFFQGKEKHIPSSQTAFIQGRNISDNTMSAEEMLYGFFRKRTLLRGAALALNLKRLLTQLGGKQ